jgi:lysyl-tRNA synthetase, class I
MAEKFFWADQIADNIIKIKGNKKEYVCASGITPSGTVHIGNFREVITTDLVVRALQDKGKKVKFIYSWDDFDRFRKVPKGISKEYEKYLGMPISDFPSPFNKSKTYAGYFEKEFEKSLEKVGIKPKFIQQNKMNKQHKYAELIKVALDKRDKIIEILNKYRKEPLEKTWMPIMIYCSKCKKDMTKIIGSKNYELEYECKCGHKEKIDIRKKGLISIRWRVDWPLRWKYEEVDFEPGGIDHSVHGGSFTTSKEIIKEVFEGEIPVYQFYDWIKIKGGEEFSSSKGNALTLNDVEEIYEPEVLRYLFVGTKPKTGFQISFDNDVIKNYEDYGSLEKRYYSEEANPREKRIYELSRLKISKKQPERISFRHLITIVQTGQTDKLKPEQKARAEKVKNWLEKYAGEDMKFEIQTKVNSKLKSKEKEILKELNKRLKKKDFTEKELFNEFYEICQMFEIKNTEFFDLTYETIINKKKGPRLANLILTAGKQNIIKLLNQIK